MTLTSLKTAKTYLILSHPFLPKDLVILQKRRLRVFPRNFAKNTTCSNEMEDITC